MKKQRKDYNTEALRLSRAIDIAVQAFEKYPPSRLSKENLNQSIIFYTEIKSRALNPQPKFKKVVSLNYLIEATLLYFQESSGMEVDYFWEQIEKEELGYNREDKLRKVLKRGKINNRTEFDYITDIVVLAQQENRISNEEATQLKNMLGEFEAKKIKQK